MFKKLLSFILLLSFTNAHSRDFRFENIPTAPRELGPISLNDFRDIRDIRRGPINKLGMKILVSNYQELKNFLNK